MGWLYSFYLGLIGRILLLNVGAVVSQWSGVTKAGTHCSSRFVGEMTVQLGQRVSHFGLAGSFYALKTFGGSQRTSLVKCSYC